MVEGKSPHDFVPEPPQKPSHPIIELLEWMVAAGFIAGLLFILFHAALLAFSVGYKLSAYFHYLP